MLIINSMSTHQVEGKLNVTSIQKGIIKSFFNTTEILQDTLNELETLNYSNNIHYSIFIVKPL